jgi:AhpD family alkylhydroperoxidase
MVSSNEQKWTLFSGLVSMFAPSMENQTGARIPYDTLQKLASAEIDGLYAIEKALAGSGLKARLREIIKVRASQINGCAYCLGFHVPKARAAGLTDDEIHLLNAWRETPSFTAAERAVIEFTEHLTLVSEHHVPGYVYEALQPFFTPEQIVKITFAVIVINGWNRLMITFTVPPETGK